MYLIQFFIINKKNKFFKFYLKENLVSATGQK